MSCQEIGSLGEFIAASATVATLLYLSAQIRQTNLITTAQFGHGLTHRLYERFFHTAKDQEFAEFIGKDWASEDIDSVDKSRITIFTIMLLVDLFDVYDKVQQGLVEKKHLDMRVHMLRTGIFRSPTGERVWKFWKNLRDAEFADWFEKNIVDPSTTAELVKRMQEENPELFNELKGDHEKSENSFFRVD